MNHPPTQGLIKSLKRQEKGISSQPISWSLQTAMRPWAGLPWQQWDSGEKGSWIHEGPLPERRYCWRQSKRGINVLPSPLLPHSSASYWMNPTGRQLTKDLGSCNSLRCRAEVGRDGKWIWEVAGKLPYSSWNTWNLHLWMSLFMFFLKSRRKILVWAFFSFFKSGSL